MRSKRPSLLVQVMCILGALLLLPIPIWLALSPASLDPMGMAWHLGVHEALPFVGAGLFVLAQLWRLFARYRRGDMLSAGTARVFAAFAWGVVALALMHIVGFALMSVALSWDNPPGQRLLRVTVEWKDYVLLLLGAALVAVARVMVRAAAAEEENRSFV
jgi:hypothetical protein